MSHKVNHQQFITTRQRQRYINTRSPSIKPTHILSLDFEQTNTKKSTLKYKTIDQILSWKSTRSKFVTKYGRKATTNIRQGDVDVTGSIELSRMNEGNQIISYRDKEHFQYLIKALTGIKKGKKLSEIQRYKTREENHKTEALLTKETKKSPIRSMFSNQPQMRNKKQIRDHNWMNDANFKRILQNQQKLRSKSKATDIDFTILGQEQLKINKISRQRYRKGKGF